MEDEEVIRAATFALIGSFLLSTCAHAQSTWEVTPYQMKVWWVTGEEPELPDGWKTLLEPTLARQLRGRFAGVCDTSIEQAPESIRLAMRRNLNGLNREQLFATDPEISKLDKLFLVTISSHRQTFSVQVREFDCLLTHFGPTDVRQTNLLTQVMPLSTEMIANLFSPVVRIDRASGKIAKTRLRAGALMRLADSPGTLREYDVLLPYDRRVDSSGKASLQAIRPIDWSYLHVPKNLATQGYRELDIISGYRQPFRSKRSRRRQQYAIRTRPLTDLSTIRLLSREKKEPLAGYEIHEKGETATRFLGYTDWKGELAIPPDKATVRMLLVRSGERVLAKLPTVPGLRKEIIAYLRDDSLRVEADGFLSGVQMGIIDLVARRESLTTRIRKLIDEKDFDRAQRLLYELRDLPTATQVGDNVNRQLAELDLAKSKALRTKITTTFVQTVSTLGKYLDPGRANQLESELNQARALQ